VSSENIEVILERIAVLETKLDDFLQKTADFEKRIRMLERSLWILIGVVLIIQYLFEHLHK
jgi:hypothetical protein